MVVYMHMPRKLSVCYLVIIMQGSHRLDMYLNFEGFLEMSLKITSAFKSTRKSLKGHEKSLNSFFCRT